MFTSPDADFKFAKLTPFASIKCRYTGLPNMISSLYDDATFTASGDLNTITQQSGEWAYLQSFIGAEFKSILQYTILPNTSNVSCI